MSKFFIAGILLFLLLAAAGSQQTTQAARYIPWNCADWQAFAHADRTTAILESLAENRGKTLYCGIDQSDTFAKAETWEAGRDRNERDGTVYWGERGSFRGFIAAQEGWLTEGESGITGQSIATIFEFPREEQRRRKKTVRRIIRGVIDSRDYFAGGCTPPGGGGFTSGGGAGCGGPSALYSEILSVWRSAYNGTAPRWYDRLYDQTDLLAAAAEARCRGGRVSDANFDLAVAIPSGFALSGPTANTYDSHAMWQRQGANNAPKHTWIEVPWTAKCVKKVRR